MSEGFGLWPTVRFDLDDFAELVASDGFVDLFAEHQWALREQMRTVYVRQWDERRPLEHRRAWSGPDKFDRQILRMYRVSAADIGLVPRSVFSSEYRRRQRARVKRGRR